MREVELGYGVFKITPVVEPRRKECPNPDCVDGFCLVESAPGLELMKKPCATCGGKGYITED